MKKLCVLRFSVFLSGCISWQPSDFDSNKKDQYLTSKNGPDLLVPPPLTNSNLSDFYVLPDQKQDPKVPIEPPAAK